MDHKKVKWGIIGLGKIANHFAKDLRLIEDAKLYAVGSRSMEKAETFASEYQASKSYDSYDQLFNDAEVDIVYIATPHDSHAELSIRAMRAGKHVLCEKPLAVNKDQVASIVKVAKETRRFMMEAFWARFNPSIQEVITRMKDGDLGDVNYVNADFTFSRNDSVDSRMLNPNLAGGSLLDMGVYPVFLAYAALGNPREIKSIGTLHDNGVDLQTATILNYDGAVASIMSGFTSQSFMQAQICGTKGSVILHPTWHEAQGYTFMDAKTKEKVSYDKPTIGRGYSYEIMECHECLRLDKLESDKWPLQSSLDMITITDEIRRQVGVKYPFEL